jgi:hypothetical protein
VEAFLRQQQQPTKKGNRAAVDSFATGQEIPNFYEIRMFITVFTKIIPLIINLS